MSLPMTDTLGWVATLVFVSSYFFSKPAALRTCQMLGADSYGYFLPELSAVAPRVRIYQ